MDKLARLPWLSNAMSVFYSQLSKDVLAHAQLLCLEKGYGAELLLNEFSSAALCESKVNGVACGQCHSCKLHQADNHPDCYEIKPDGKQIKVDQIRELCKKLSETAQLDGWRVAIIYESEKLNTAAANALLKTLEEPGKDTLIFLQAGSSNRLMPTIVSRCQKIQINIPSKMEIEEWLSTQNIEHKGTVWALPIVGGPLNLVESIDSGYYQTLYSYRQAWVDSLSKGHLASLLSGVSEEQVLDSLNVLYLVLRQFTLQKKFQDAVSQMRIINLAAEVMEMRQRLSVMAGVNSVSLLQKYLLKYRNIINN